MLSREQQEIIENSLWIVNTALKRQGLQTDNDLRQSAILYMCQCIERFDPTKDIKWTTFAYKNVYLFIKRKHRKEMEYNYFISNNRENEVVRERVYTEEYNNYYKDNQRYTLEEVEALCSQKEKKILNLKLQGYNMQQISDILKCSSCMVGRHVAVIKHKTREVLLEK